MGLSLDELKKMGATPATGLSPTQMQGAGATAPKSFFDDGLDSSMTSLGSSQSMLDKSRVFQTPLTEIAGGHGDELMEPAKGGIKAALKDFFSVGAGHAGPVGEGMRQAGPEWAKAMDAFEGGLNPTNTSQAVGAGQVDAAGLLAGGKGLMSLAKGAAEATGLSGFFAARKEAKGVGKIAEALNPELTGKKLAKAYQGVGTGDRSALPKKLFQEQSLTPDEDTVDLAGRLKGRGSMMGKNGLQDLESISKDFEKTEKTIDDLFGSDPSLVYNADKQTLFEGLDELHTKIPEEFKAIKENQTVYDAVVNYGKKVAQEAEDTPKGIREARKKFDFQAKTEFPTAYDDSGVINMKSPAGRGIRAVRDLLNNHTYETAPEGSAIKQEILHESDLYKAIQRLAPKAATEHGMSQIKTLMKKHPYLTGLLSGILGADVVAEIKQRI